MLNIISEETQASQDWSPYIQRYRKGEWRDRIFRDLILAEARRLSRAPTLLDIGCGRGFDSNLPLQQSLIAASQRYIGIEPDENVTPCGAIHEVHRCLLEDAAIAPASVDVAFAVMVLEHVANPQRFWNKLHEVIKPGGVFWGFTIDARHWYCSASMMMERLAVKDFYLDMLLGRRGSERYENYPVYYRSNHPTHVARYARQFKSCEFINISKIGQLNGYMPRALRPIFDWVDRRALEMGKPGTLLAIRAVK